MINRPFIQSQKYKDQQMRADRQFPYQFRQKYLDEDNRDAFYMARKRYFEDAHQDILEFERRLITRMRKQNVPLFCHCLWRDNAEQTRLFVTGRSKAKAGQSAHNWGMAVDIVHSTLAWELQPMSWALLGHIGKEISVQSGIAVTWGGDWSFHDPAHWELSDWKATAALAEVE